MRVLPAHAGVILDAINTTLSEKSITRTCGGDPESGDFEESKKYVLPAHAGVILNY